jgi:hypothetical protein
MSFDFTAKPPVRKAEVRKPRDRRPKKRISAAESDCARALPIPEIPKAEILLSGKMSVIQGSISSFFGRQIENHLQSVPEGNAGASFTKSSRPLEKSFARKKSTCAAT